MNKVDIKEIAKYLIYYFNHRGESITNKKLQKLLYYIQAWHLVYFEDNLFDDVPEAWVHGPVYPAIYQLYKKYKAKPITFYNGVSREECDGLLDSFGVNDDQKEFIGSIIHYYGAKSAFALEMLSHKERPWLEAREGMADYDLSRVPISLTTMHEYYRSLLT